MTQRYCIQDIREALQPLNLPNKDFLADFLVAILTCQKARIAKIANAMPGEAKPESNQQRIRRFLDHPRLDFAPALAALIPKAPPWTLAIDRTNWKTGERDVNLLTLAVVVGNIAIPLLWADLLHPGNSDTAQRIALMQEFVALFGQEAIRIVIGDREFIGADWLAWLDQAGIAFLVRLRKDDPLMHPRKGSGPAWRYFSRACRGKGRAWRLWGTAVFVAGKRLAGGEYLILASNRFHPDQLLLYRHRWSIECLFQALKGRGFDLEGCTTPRIAAFFGLLSLTLLWCVRMGMYLSGIDPLKPLCHGRAGVSWFRRGLDHLGRLVSVLSGCPNSTRFDRALLMLRPVPLPAKICV